ncbi:uncharacterized protein [Drosophila kikkawai]|uniref:lysozyme n=1 Tax=Drosophila kikkawai TaxID=30033 RepID=A0A6P4HZ98_DROKI|nr:uncharacterized protein LOC108073845 [Drosophila kikkawai]
MDPSSSRSVLQLAEEADPETGTVMETEMETDASKMAEHRGYAEALSLSGRSNKRRLNRRSCGTGQILTASAIFFALMLIVGAIFMHLKHKHHLGRLHIHLRDHAEHLPLVAAAGVAAQTITTFQPATDPSPSSATQPPPSTPATQPPPSSPASQPPPLFAPPRLVTDECLACIAIAATNNVPGVCRSKVGDEWPCGIYRISPGYWEDAQRLIDPKDTLARDYKGCVVDDDCAGRIVRSYVERYAFDCNQDGRIECRDHAILHMRGPSGCRRQEHLTSPVEKRLEVCLI